MPPLPVPPDVDEFLAQPNAAVIATLRPDGAPHTAATWYDWEDSRALLNMEASRVRLGYMRRDPRVSLTVLDLEQWYRQVTLMGRIVRIEEDPNLADIDRLARRYTGREYRDRNRKQRQRMARAGTLVRLDGRPRLVGYRARCSMILRYAVM